MIQQRRGTDSDGIVKQKPDKRDRGKTNGRAVCHLEHVAVMSACYHRPGGLDILGWNSGKNIVWRLRLGDLESPAEMRA